VFVLPIHVLLVVLLPEVVVLLVLIELLVELELAVALVDHVATDGLKALVVLTAVEAGVADSDLLAQIGHQALEVRKVLDLRDEEAVLASCVVEVLLEIAAFVSVKEALCDGNGPGVLEPLLDHLLLRQLFAKKRERLARASRCVASTKMTKGEASANLIWVRVFHT
jgi:hypothetical protein